MSEQAAQACVPLLQREQIEEEAAKASSSPKAGEGRHPRSPAAQHTSKVSRQLTHTYCTQGRHLHSGQAHTQPRSGVAAPPCKQAHIAPRTCDIPALRVRTRATKPFGSSLPAQNEQLSTHRLDQLVLPPATDNQSEARAQRTARGTLHALPATHTHICTIWSLRHVRSGGVQPRAGAADTAAGPTADPTLTAAEQRRAVPNRTFAGEEHAQALQRQLLGLGGAAVRVSRPRSADLRPSRSRVSSKRCLRDPVAAQPFFLEAGRRGGGRAPAQLRARQIRGSQVASP